MPGMTAVITTARILAFRSGSCFSRLPLLHWGYSVSLLKSHGFLTSNAVQSKCSCSRTCSTKGPVTHPCMAAGKDAVLQACGTSAVTHHTSNLHSSKCSRRNLHCGSESRGKMDASAEILTESELADLAIKVMSEASKVDVMVKSVPQAKVERIILDLHNCGVHTADINILLASHPRYITSSKLITALDNLLNNGLQPAQAVSVLHDFEGVLNISAGKIMDVCDALRDARFYDKSLPVIISKDPSVLLLTKKAISQRIGALRQLFTTADVVTLILNYPQLLTGDWSDIQAKFDYVFNEMKVTQKQMVFAALFRHSLQHIKHRHAFLVRAGLFDMSKRREGEKSPNARLDQIIDSPDDAFCRKFGFRVEEYRAFCKLFDKELSMEVSDEDS
ncbi:hypothetical protein BaRGS_00038785 [Batillaria attramentaria]|uniref:Uncharacterized protein n=1 Tax=Batillaria attramentaria TaxID=370345 RepID=A0ABD0J587_9CAEN